MTTRQYEHFRRPTFETVLPNGLTVITVELPVPATFICIVLDVGLVDDPINLPGVAHFLEHAVFEGQAREDVHPILQPLAPLGIEGNASTGEYRTRYWLLGPPDRTALMVDALIHLVFTPDITEEVIEQERPAIEQERAELVGDREYAYWLQRVFYPSMRFPGIEETGSREHIAAITMDDLMATHRERYVLGRAAMVIASPLPHTDVVSMVSVASDRIVPATAYHGTRRPAQLHHPRRGIREVFTGARVDPNLILFFDGPDPNTPDALACDVAMGLLDKLLLRRLRLRDRLIYGVDSKSPQWPMGTIMLRLPTAVTRFDAVLEKAWEEIERLQRGDISSDLYFGLLARRKLRRSIARCSVDPGGWGGDIADRWIEGDLDVDYGAIRKAMTFDDVIAAAATYLTRERWSDIRTLPRT